MGRIACGYDGLHVLACASGIVQTDAVRCCLGPFQGKCVSVRARVCMCVGVWVRARAVVRARARVCVCSVVCVCVRVPPRARARVYVNNLR